MTSSTAWDDPTKMTSVDAVIDRILSLVEPLAAVDVDLSDALGLVLAADVVASSNVPPFRNSAMDGFAIRSSDTREGKVSHFDLTGTIAAGAHSPVRLDTGQAARIMTGAPVPDGADAVVRFEEVEQDSENTVRISRRVSPGENVRLAGEDVRRGETVFGGGTKLGASEIGVLAALNLARVGVHRRPRVGILSTGDEVVGLGPELKPGQIRDANAYALSASVETLGAVAVRLGIAADSRGDLTDRLRAAEDCDILLTSGGVSVGDFDMVKKVLRQEGRVDVLTVRMKPGKPLAIGQIGETPLLGLPGNPAAAMVAFDQIARPAILKMLGHADLWLPIVRARLLADVNNRGRRRHFERGVLTWDGRAWVVEPTGIHGSAMLTSLVAANCYIVVDEEVSQVTAGAVVDVQVLDLPSGLQAPAGDVLEREAE